MLALLGCVRLQAMFQGKSHAWVWVGRVAAFTSPLLLTLVWGSIQMGWLKPPTHAVSTPPRDDVRYFMVPYMPDQSATVFVQQQLAHTPDGALILADHTPLGALNSAKAAGLQTLLVSGGFTFFADRVRERLGMHEAHSNTLEIEGGLLTGRVLGDIVDGEAKKQHLLRLCERIGCDPRQSIAVGDGANDLLMMGVAGLSVAYHAKPKVREQAMVSIQAGGLDRVLELFS